jgi:hypothetical protein
LLALLAIDEEERSAGLTALAGAVLGAGAERAAAVESSLLSVLP